MHNPYFSLIRSVWQQGRTWRLTIVAYYFAYIIAQAALSFSPYAFGRVIDILQHFKPYRLHEVIVWLSLSVVLVFLFWLFHGPARVQERYVALKIQQRFRINLYQQLTELPLKWHQNHHSGNIITRVNRASLALFRFAGDQFVYIETIVKFVVSISFLLWISLPVGLFSLFSCILATITVVLFDRKLIPLYDAENENDNHVGAVFFDYISNMTTILTLRLTELTRTNLWQRILSIWPFYSKDVILNEVKWFSMGILLSITQSIILITYVVHALDSTATIMIGTVVMIFRYQWDLSDVFYNLSAHYSELVRMNTDLQGVNPLLQDMERFARPPLDTILIQQWHEIKINDLIFHHAGHNRDEKIFNQINFSIKRGEKIALIGLSGGGKSTLLNLLRGLYQADYARLMIDQTEFANLEPLQAITTLIPQDPELFENTLEFNITMDVPATTDEINHMVELAGFSDVLAALPLGLKTDIREKGLNLSVGQKQRLALARGLFAARQSSLILMDEPTSSVDIPTEKQILSNVIEAFPDAAIMVSLHRLHLLPKFDRIIMLSAGQVVASGAVADLLNQPGPVHDLWVSYQDQ